MKYLIKKPDTFLNALNEDISAILQKSFDNLFPEYIFHQELKGMAMPVDVKEYEDKGVSFNDLCTGCGYCMPCPMKVDIPGAFAAYNVSSVDIKKYVSFKEAFSVIRIGSLIVSLICNKSSKLLISSI